MGLWQSTANLFTDVWAMSTKSLTENTKYSVTLTQKVRHWKRCSHCHKIFVQRTQHHTTPALTFWHRNFFFFNFSTLCI
jgi:hypothetical protein